jgi:BirA family biotin operon repressor/biotin-[acetyl-CoA-carboxylase] ligase
MGGSTWEGRDVASWRETLGLPEVHLFDTTGSTNDVARNLAEAGAPSLTLVVADHQTSGRGRAGRSWLSAPGSSLLCSVVFRPGHPAGATPGAAPVRIGHAVARAIERVAGVDARVKWPNDVVIPGHGKVAGILCESASRQGSMFVVAGIGVNVRAPGSDYASLSQISGRIVDRGALLGELVTEIAAIRDSITAPLSDDERAALHERDVLLNQEVVDDSGQAGIARGVAADGSLLLETGQGIVAVHNATIRLARTREYPGARV